MRSTTPVRGYLAKLALLAGAYTAVLYLSLFLVPVGGSGASLVWPPTVVALTALLLFGVELWPALLVPCFIFLLAGGVVPPAAAGVALANTLEALIGVYILRRLDFGVMFGRLQDALVFVLAALVSTLFSATTVALVLYIFHGTSFGPLWLGLWIGHAVSLLFLGPLLIRSTYKPFFTRTTLQWVEGAGIIGLIFALSIFIYWTPYSSIGSVSLLYISIVPLIWVALRMGPRGISLALAGIGLIATTGVLFGGVFGTGEHSPQILFGVQFIIGILSLIFLLPLSRSAKTQLLHCAAMSTNSRSRSIKSA